MDHNGTISSYDYIKKIYDLASFFESNTVSSNNKVILHVKVINQLIVRKAMFGL